MDISGNLLADSLNIEEVRALAVKVVGRYIGRQIIPQREAEDVISAMVEKFLRKQETIMLAYEVRASLPTYITAVLNRMCCEVIRSESRHWYSVSDIDSSCSDSFSHQEADTATLIRSEADHLAQLIRNKEPETQKILLMARFFYNHPVTLAHVEAWAPHEAQEVFRLLQRDDDTSKGELFARMAEAVNRVERKNVKPDAVRMWFNKMMDVLIQGLNRDRFARHTRETLVLLIERLHGHKFE